MASMLQELSSKNLGLQEISRLMTKEIQYPSLQACNRNTRRTVHLVPLSGIHFLLSYRGYYLLRMSFLPTNVIVIEDASCKMQEREYRQIYGFDLLRSAMERLFFNPIAPTFHIDR